MDAKNTLQPGDSVIIKDWPGAGAKINGTPLLPGEYGDVHLEFPDGTVTAFLWSQIDPVSAQYDGLALEAHLSGLVEEYIEVVARVQFMRQFEPQPERKPDTPMSVEEYLAFKDREAQAQHRIDVHRGTIDALIDRAIQIEKAFGSVIGDATWIRVPAFNQAVYAVWCGRNNYSMSGYNISADAVREGEIKAAKSPAF